MGDKVRTIKSLPKLPPRPPEAHKGDFGRVLMVGGSGGMIGAPALAALGALRGGAGLVVMALPEPIQLAAAALCPCATSAPLTCSKNGELAAEAVRQVVSAAEGSDVLAVGCGMGVAGGAGRVVRALLGQDRPVVLDADGLNNLARIDEWPTIVACPLVLTPHPGELARLTGRAIREVQADRVAAAVDAARAWSRPGKAPPVVALKGAATVVTDGKRVYVNRTGNPGMASGGSGDVLTGLLAALIGQGLEAFDAACLGVHLHGLAGDLAADKLGQVSLIATDLIDFLPAAFAQFRSA